MSCMDQVLSNREKVVLDLADHVLTEVRHALSIILSGDVSEVVTKWQDMGRRHTGSYIWPTATERHAADLSASGSWTSTARTPFWSSIIRYCLASREGFSRSPVNNRYGGRPPDAGTCFQDDMGRIQEPKNERLCFEGTGDRCRWLIGYSRNLGGIMK